MIKPTKTASMVMVLSMMVFTLGCQDDVEVDLSGLPPGVLRDFGSTYAVSSYLWMLSKYGLPDEVNGRHVQQVRDLWRNAPNEKIDHWSWHRDSLVCRVADVIFEPLIDMYDTPVTPQNQAGDLTVEQLRVCELRTDFCVEFTVDGLSSYRALTVYRIDVLINCRGRWLFLWGGCPVIDWRGRRALDFFGWIDKNYARRLMEGEDKLLLLVVLRDMLTGEQRKAVEFWSYEVDEGR